MLGFLRTTVVVLIPTLMACATARPPGPAPGRLAELEARMQRDPTGAEARLELGAAYVQAGRDADAIAVLEPVTSPASAPAAAFFLGLANENLSRTAEARRYYSDYLERGESPALKRRVRARLILLDRRDLELSVRAALADEQRLAAAEPAARTVGVFPFLTGAGEDLRPLGRALAELLSSDLAQTDRIRVVERARIQLLLDEIRLAEAGRVDPQSAARAGHLLGVSRIVQGRVDGGEAALRLETMMVPVPAVAAAAPSPIVQQGALRDVFALQAELALELYRALGIELTVAERERVTRRPTENVQALLAFGSGLEAEDGGRYAEAAAHYRRAVGADAAFEQARTALARALAAAEAVAESPAELALDASIEIGFDFGEWSRRRQRFAGVDRMVPGSEVRDPVAEILGFEGLDRRTLIQVLIRRPGGGT